jgi:hypothetical protein
MSVFDYLHLREPLGDRARLESAVADMAAGVWRDGGRSVWGVWEGLFGVASNELLVITSSDGTAGGEPPVAAGVEVLESVALLPTARPGDRAPLRRAGLYVFRSFDVLPEDVDEFVDLSTRAWRTFEHAEDYAAEPQGLFRPLKMPTEGPAGLLLVTWYDGLASWETSRRPAQEAAENFQRRRTLTRATGAVAARLLVASAPP